MSPDPFDPVFLNTLELKNRFILSAAASGTAADRSGVITDEEITRLCQYPEHGVGLVITGAIGIRETAISHANSGLLINEKQVAGFKRLCDCIHKRGGRVAVQLCHSGIWTGRHTKELQTESIGPSRLIDNPYTNRQNFFDNYHEATNDEIAGVIHAFGSAAALAKKADFDAIEIHGAHDSLLSQFLSPLTNHRSDEWGGSREKRVRIHCEIMRSVREAVGPDYPVLLKLGVADGIKAPGALSFKDGRNAARICIKAGYNALEISQGLQGPTFLEMALRSPINRMKDEGFSREWTKAVKSDGAVTIMTGGLRSWELVSEVIRLKETDCVGLCRPLICEPDLGKRWKAGDRKKSACISCNKCAFAIVQGLPLACYRDEDI